MFWYIREGNRCFSEIESDLKGVSPKMLTARLRRLEHEGLIERVTRTTSSPTVWYALTPVRKELGMALAEVVSVSQRLKPSSGGLPADN